MNKMYDDFIQKSLAYVVSSVKFLAFSTHPSEIIRPAYLPYEHVAGFNKLYDEKIAFVAQNTKMSEKNPHLYVRRRIHYNRSLFAMDAYREIFCDHDNPGTKHKVVPVHFPLHVHFNPDRKAYCHPFAQQENMRNFINNFHSTDMPHLLNRKVPRLCFYAETFEAQVLDDPSIKKDIHAFKETVYKNTAAIMAMAYAYQNVAKHLEPYVAG